MPAIAEVEAYRELQLIERRIQQRFKRAISQGTYHALQIYILEGTGTHQRLNRNSRLPPRSTQTETMAAGQADSQIPGAVPSKPGILFVLSTVLDPSDLEPSSFTDWYENTHIQEVQSTGGISGSQRYEALTFSKSYRGKDFGFSETPANRNLNFDFVTVYQMPDLAFRETEAFRGLDGQTAPRKELLEGLFKHVSFITRFAEEVSTTISTSGDFPTTPAPFVITMAPKAAGGALPKIEATKGLRCVKEYKVHEGSLLSRFERSWLDEPTDLAILEFNSEEGVAAVADAVGGAKGLEVGFWALRRDYGGGERTPKGWSPQKG